MTSFEHLYLMLEEGLTEATAGSDFKWCHDVLFACNSMKLNILFGPQFARHCSLMHITHVSPWDTNYGQWSQSTAHLSYFAIAHGRKLGLYLLCTCVQCLKSKHLENETVTLLFFINENILLICLIYDVSDIPTKTNYNKNPNGDLDAPFLYHSNNFLVQFADL